MKTSDCFDFANDAAPVRGEERAAPAAAVPCLFKNNSISPWSPNVLSAYHKRTAFALAFNIERMAKVFGLGRLGFLTLTVPDRGGISIKEFSKRFNSLSSNFMRKRYGGYIMVPERGEKNGRLHAHLVVVLPFEAREGFDFEAVKAGDYSSACQELKEEWRAWREAADRYGFGRVELLPVKSTAEGIARYVGKYISKNIAGRQSIDKGARLVRYSQGCNLASVKFSWFNVRSALWRKKLGLVFGKLGITSLEQVAEKFGPRWVYYLADCLAGLQCEVYRNKAEAEADGLDVYDLPDDVTDIRGASTCFVIERMTAAQLEQLIRKDRIVVKAMRGLRQTLQRAYGHASFAPVELETNSWGDLHRFLREFVIPVKDPEWTSGLTSEQGGYFAM